MEPKQIIETTGSITKLEMLSNVKDGILPNTLVLTNKDPFPGFIESNLSESKGVKPKSYYLILMYRYFNEKLERISRSLISENILSCYSSFGEIIINSSIYPCIRIKHLKSDKLIKDVQYFYKHNDIKFMSYKEIEREGIIKVSKHFKLIELVEGIYRDMIESKKLYFKIPSPINLKLLAYVTKNVKNIIRNPNFDAALGIINRFNGPEDVIRIYDTDKSLKRALEIKKYYMKEIKKKKLLVTNYHNNVGV